MLGAVLALLMAVPAVADHKPGHAPPGGGGGTPPGQTPTPPGCEKFPAKLALARATVVRRERLLDVLAPITSRASGRVDVEFHAAGQRTRFTAPVNSVDGRIRFRQRIPRAQARLGTGILTLAYPGDPDTRPQVVRLRAAARKARLEMERPRIAGNRLRAEGTVTRRARGVVRIQLQYLSPTCETITLHKRAQIQADGSWRLDEVLSQEERDGIESRRGSVHSYTLFTGYYPRRIRGEMRSFEVLPAPK